MTGDADSHWTARAISVQDDYEVNIADVFQRELEYEFILPFMRTGMRVLEAGCGNGYSTARIRPLVAHVDAFDSSERMIERARAKFGESNNRFIHDTVLGPTRLGEAYDAVLCVRLLINLANLAEQTTALGTLCRFTRPGGILILAEGFSDGFAALSELRQSVGLGPIEPAAINVYSARESVVAGLREEFTVDASGHLGAYDVLTRVFYPLLVGAENARHNTEMSEKAARLARALNPEALRRFSRMQLLVLRKRSAD